MTKKRRTRRALINSVISLLICFSMLLGTTFAWFTDEVTTGMNTIQAGNLDVELQYETADGKFESVEDVETLFNDVKLWEPGVVAYENLQVVNKGNLALKYQMSLNFGNENNLDGHKLSEVLKVAVLEKSIENGATRTKVLELAKDAVETDQGTGALSNFYLTGELDAGNTGEAFAVVIFWEPNDNEIDNLYNANNGQKTSDGEPLHIDFGVNLQATQMMHEEDSFGKDYDEFASILPKATVNNVSAKYPTVTATAGIGGTASEIPMDFALQFLPNETLNEAESNGYRYWHADYVISADRDVKADSMALAGYYDAWCRYNNNNWVALTAGDDIEAGTEIRLVELLGAYVNYEEICQYGNDGIGFLCGATDLTGENAGTTITVELRLYETTVDPASGTGNKNVETGNYEVVGKYTYTFGMGEQDSVKRVATTEELQAALDTATDGAIIALTADITGNVVVTQKADVDVTINGCGNEFNGVMTVYGNSRQAGEETLTIKDIDFVAAEGASSCIVSPDSSVNNKYSYAHNVTVEGCSFTDPDGVVNCAAVRTEDGGDKNWVVKDCNVDNTMHSLLQVQNIEGNLTIAGCDVYSKNGANLNSTTNLEMTGCNFDVTGYAVRFGVSSGGNLGTPKNYVLTNNTLKSVCDDGDAVIMFRASAVDATLTLDNTTLIGTTEISGNTADTMIIR